MTVNDLIFTKKTCGKTLLRHFHQFLDNPPEFKYLKENQEVYLKIDGSYFKRWGCVLVYKTNTEIIYTDFVSRENYFSYANNLNQITRMGYIVKGVTSDGVPGLESALKTLFSDNPHQFCLVHLQRLSQSLLTRNPETKAGVELLELIKHVNTIKTHYDKNIWLLWFRRFENRYGLFINQRTHQFDNQGKLVWWYTHRNLRRVYRTIKRNLDHYFLYLEYPGLPKDTNGLEAEFSHLKRKLSLHRGLKRHRKANFVKWYFWFKSNSENH